MDYPALSARCRRFRHAHRRRADLGGRDERTTRANRPVIVLLSDGDDPATDANDPTKDDGEWLEGVTAAKTKHIRVHTVGIGDPHQSHTIPIGKELLMYEGQPVRTSCTRIVFRKSPSVRAAPISRRIRNRCRSAISSSIARRRRLREEEPVEADAARRSAAVRLVFAARGGVVDVEPVSQRRPEILMEWAVEVYALLASTMSKPAPALGLDLEGHPALSWLGSRYA